MKTKICNRNISAKHFKKLRKKAKFYLVIRSQSGIGFPEYNDGNIKLIALKKYTEVLARYPMEAAYRYMKRKKALTELSRYLFTPDLTDRSCAKLRVIPKENPIEDYVTYWR